MSRALSCKSAESKQLVCECQLLSFCRLGVVSHLPSYAAGKPLCTTRHFWWPPACSVLPLSGCGGGGGGGQLWLLTRFKAMRSIYCQAAQHRLNAYLVI